MKMQYLTFKQLIRMLAEVETKADAWDVECEVKKSYEHDKITWADHELIYSLLGKLEYTD